MMVWTRATETFAFTDMVAYGPKKMLNLLELREEFAQGSGHGGGGPLLRKH